jgi:hypothetical protein
MGSWFSSTKNDNTTNKNSKNTINNNSPKPASYSFFSKPPNFAILFGKNSREKLMDKYDVYNNNLNGNNFAQVFIHKIVNDPNLTLKDKLNQLSYFSSVLQSLKFKSMSKNKLNGVKKAHEIVFDNYEKYRKQISNAIKKLQNQNKKTNANKGANSGVSAATSQNANKGANSGVSAATSQNANKGANSGVSAATSQNVNKGANSGVSAATSQNANKATNSGTSVAVAQNSIKNTSAAAKQNSIREDNSFDIDKKISDENMNDLQNQINFLMIASTSNYFSHSRKSNNGSKIVSKKYLNFIKFLLLFKKIMNNKKSFKSDAIDKKIDQLLRNCTQNPFVFSNDKCKSEKIELQNGTVQFELLPKHELNLNANMYPELFNSDTKFQELLQIEMKTDEEFNKLKDEFNKMLDIYYRMFNVREGSRVKILSANQADT